MKKRILVMPLNWGLGHATRCIPIIRALIAHNFEPIIASDGDALALLRKEFPNLESLELPSYKIHYAKKGQWFKLKLIANAPNILKAIQNENKMVDQIIATRKIDGIISDNRLGAYSKKVPSVIISHQLRVLSGNTTWFSTRMHQSYIKKYNECWVPDGLKSPNLSGQLGHVDNFEIPLRYLGPISRFEKQDSKDVYDIMVLLSGPEPQRTLLEEKVLALFKDQSIKTVFIKGVMDEQQTCEQMGNMTIYNYMSSDQLEATIHQSSLIVSRSGYTTVMDLAKLGKKAFFIPTPGQFEQEYLAKRLDSQKLVPYCKQDDFNLEQLQRVNAYQGLSELEYDVNYKKLFSLFKGE
ncbi:glycosyltransferase [Mangrovimonas sp. DI 80]|uniref:glycosyltransferase n=1 Tax=Mangrovimonas sp. DI 80 TaxID=1779330 RepID=UPI000977BDD4|nr:glycosyltransferase [Mangrovimonas sp. DI 80]OMP32616.1 glycosyltransferase [Mangrovimonas sp. DI 80]